MIICYLIPIILPFTILSYNYYIYIKLEELYKKTNNIEKNINYFLSYQYIDIKNEENLNKNNLINNNYKLENEDNLNKIYLVL
jgi:hypothetical protein